MRPPWDLQGRSGSRVWPEHAGRSTPTPWKAPTPRSGTGRRRRGRCPRGARVVIAAGRHRHRDDIARYARRSCLRPAGVLTAFGLAAIGGAVLYGLSGSNADALSRSPIAAAEALMALPDPCYVTDRRGSLLFANAAYRALTGGFDGDRTVPVERLLAGRGEGAEVSFRLAQAARTGFAAEEDVTIGPRNAERVYRAIVRPLRRNVRRRGMRCSGTRHRRAGKGRVRPSVCHKRCAAVMWSMPCSASSPPTPTARSFS